MAARLLQSVGIVDDAVEDGVGEGWFADDIVPLGQRQLAGDQGGGPPRALVQTGNFLLPSRTQG